MTLKRRVFLQQAGLMATSFPTWSGFRELSRPAAADLPRNAPLPSPPQQWGGLVLQADQGELLVSGRRRAPLRIKVDSAKAPGVTMSMVMSEVAPGAVIPVHRHTHEDELIFIHAGRGLATLGEAQLPVSAGAMLYGPRGLWHGVANTGSETLLWCAIFSPAGFEQYFKEVGTAPGRGAPPPSSEKLAAAAARYGLIFRDP